MRRHKLFLAVAASPRARRASGCEPACQHSDSLWAVSENKNLLHPQQDDKRFVSRFMGEEDCGACRKSSGLPLARWAFERKYLRHPGAVRILEVIQEPTFCLFLDALPAASLALVK